MFVLNTNHWESNIRIKSVLCWLNHIIIYYFSCRYLQHTGEHIYFEERICTEVPQLLIQSYSRIYAKAASRGWKIIAYRVGHPTGAVRGKLPASSWTSWTADSPTNARPFINNVHLLYVCRISSLPTLSFIDVSILLVL